MKVPSGEDRALLGQALASLICYLPNPPLYPQERARTDVPALIELNGNHWRKILTILAKICVGDAEDWRHYRDLQLLNDGVGAISFADRLQPEADRHLVAGKASWERLGFDSADFTPLDRTGTLFARDNILLTPYPDYRQFPNRSIERAREWLNDSA